MFGPAHNCAATLNVCVILPTVWGLWQTAINKYPTISRFQRANCDTVLQAFAFGVSADMTRVESSCRFYPRTGSEQICCAYRFNRPSCQYP